MELLGQWWNQSWGTMTRCDVWLEQLDDGRLQVRWRGGDWWDRDGCLRTADATVALDALRSLMGEQPEVWRDLSPRRESNPRHTP